LVIPAEIRRELEIGPDEPVTLWVEGGVLRAMTLKQAIKNAQAIARKHLGDRTGIVDDFLRERREVSGD
jgi:bifunctional DNA-binding transcriptional regulator/antitoxin component of YhaV-PrlF toxin-antitoxin module